MTYFFKSVRACAIFLALAASLAASAQTAPPPLPQPPLTGLPATQQSALRELRSEFDRNIGTLSGEQRAIAFLQMGALYLRSGLVDAGNIALDHAVAAQPSDPRFVYLRGVAALRQRQATVAANAFSQTIRLDPNYLPAHYHLAEIQIADNNLVGARATMARILDQRKDLAPAMALLGEVALREHKYAEAIAQFEGALKLEPAANALYARLADAYAGNRDSAAAARAQALAGDTVPRIVDPLALELDGPGAANSKSSAARAVTSVRTTLEQRVTKTPSDLDARLALIELLAMNGELAAARGHAQTAATQAPGSAKVLLAQAIMSEAAGDDAGARGLLARAVAADSAHQWAQRRYGDLLLRMGQSDTAYTHYLASAGAAGEVQALASAVAAASLSNRCAAVLPILRQTAVKRPADGRLAQIEVRAVSSCPIATAAQKAQALKIAKSLYQQNADGEHAEALAMAMAANGRGGEAVDYEAEAIFDATKRGDTPSLAGRRTWLKQFERKQPVSRPWPPGNLLLAPPAMRAATAQQSASPLPKP